MESLRIIEEVQEECAEAYYKFAIFLNDNNYM